MALAEHNGICASAYFPFPNAFLEDIFKKMRPDLPVISPFDPEIMTFRLMGIIPRQLNQTGFDHLKTYLADDDSGLKLFQLSSRIADLFDQYLVFRPQLIFQWEGKKKKKKNSPSCGRPSSGVNWPGATSACIAPVCGKICLKA